MRFPLKFFYQDIEVGGESLRLYKLFLPLLIDQILRNLMTVANVFMIGRYSDDMVASIGVAVQVATLGIMVLNALSIGGTVVITQNLGNKNRERAVGTAALLIVMLSSISVILGLSGAIFAPQIMTIMQLEEYVLSDGITYFRIIAFSGILHGPLIALYAISNSHGRPKNTMLTVMFLNLLNLLGNYIVIFRPFETPLEGAFGIAVVRAASELLALFLIIYLVSRMQLGIHFKSFVGKVRSILKDILKIGIPSGIESFSISFSQLIITGLVATMGSIAVTTRIYVINIVLLVYIASIALGQAAALIIGRLAGAGDFDGANRLNWNTLKLGVFINSTLALLVVIFRYQFMGFFTDNAEIINLGAGILIICFFAEVFRSINIIQQQSLNATGDARFKMIVTVCVLWLIGLPLAWLFSFQLGLGLYGFWVAFVIEEVLRGTSSMFRWKSGRWKSKRLTV